MQSIIAFFNIVLIMMSEFNSEATFSNSFIVDKYTFNRVSIMFLVIYGFEIFIESVAKGLFND